MHQELESEYRLAASRSAHHERRTAARQASAGYFVEPRDSGGGLGRNFLAWASDRVHGTLLPDIRDFGTIESIKGAGTCLFNRDHIARARVSHDLGRGATGREPSVIKIEQILELGPVRFRSGVECC